MGQCLRRSSCTVLSCVEEAASGPAQGSRFETGRGRRTMAALAPAFPGGGFRPRAPHPGWPPAWSRLGPPLAAAHTALEASGPNLVGGAVSHRPSRVPWRARDRCCRPRRQGRQGSGGGDRGAAEPGTQGSCCLSLWLPDSWGRRGLGPPAFLPARSPGRERWLSWAGRSTLSSRALASPWRVSRGDGRRATEGPEATPSRPR